MSWNFSIQISVLLKNESNSESTTHILPYLSLMFNFKITFFEWPFIESFLSFIYTTTEMKIAMQPRNYLMAVASRGKIL